VKNGLKDHPSFNLPLDNWRRQERGFGLLRKAYAKRAAIRGQQQATFVFPQRPQQFQDCPSAADEYFE
jgi:hypothetical protein